jgi:macrolide transport system ATP-binding/permease protein
MEMILQDVQYALRQLRKTPGFTITAVLTLALGIGVNAAIFTLVNAVLLKDLPVTDPKMLVRLGDKRQCCVGKGVSGEGDNGFFSTDTYDRFRQSNPEFVDLAAMEAGYEYRPLTVRRDGAEEQARSTMAEFVSGNYFRMFGLQPAAGRLMTDADDTQGALITALMSYETWTNTYNRDPSLVGSTFWVNTKPVTIIGITPKGFYGDRLRTSPPEFYLPLRSESEVRGTSYERDPDTAYLWVIGRLKPGVSRAQLQEKLSLQLRQIFSVSEMYSSKENKPLLARQHVVLTDGGEGVLDMQESYGDHLKLLMWISGLVLLIACANVANLLLVRGMGRKAEMAVRTAIGASRGRIVRQLFTESLVLAAISGVAALAVSYAGAHFLLRMAFPGQQLVPISTEPSLTVLGFALLLSLLTAVLFGIAPTWIAAGAQPADVLRGGARNTSGGASLLQRGLVMVQAGLSLVLLVGAGLFAQSLGNLEHSDMKLNPTNRYVVHFDPQTAGYTPPQTEELYRNISNRLHEIPGVMKVGISSYSPMEDNNAGNGVQIQGQPDQNKGASEVKVTAEYFDSVGTRVVMGRGIGIQDTFGAPAVAVVNQAFLRTFLKPGENPIGRRFGSPGPVSSGDFQIVGVVEDTVYETVRWKNHEMYFPSIAQRTPSDKSPLESDTSLYASTIVIATSHPVPEMESVTRRTLSSINPNLAVVKFQTFSAQIADQFVEERMLSRLMMLFGCLAVLLATIGLYGVTSYSVARRTSEIGIRMALGAERSKVVAMILRSAMTQTLIGLAFGIPTAYYCVRFVKSQLYELTNVNLAALFVAVFILLAAALVAGWVPGRRAASIDPAQALRTE